MPLINISIPNGKSLQYAKAIANGANSAALAAFEGFLPDDGYQIIREHDPNELERQKRSGDRVMLSLIMRAGQKSEAKRAFCRKVVENLKCSPGIVTKSLISSAHTRRGRGGPWFSLFVILWIAGGHATPGADAWLDQESEHCVAPKPVRAKGLAPGMKYKELGREATTYALIFGKGDEIASGLTEFAENNYIHSGHLTGHGGLRKAVLACFDRDCKEYKKVTIDHPVEVLSLSGDFALHKGKPVLHAHVVLGFPDGQTMGGHLLEAHAHPALKVFLAPSPTPLHNEVANAHLELVAS